VTADGLGGCWRWSRAGPTRRWSATWRRWRVTGGLTVRANNSYHLALLERDRAGDLERARVVAAEAAAIADRVGITDEVTARVG
jgi:hypothetical protein